MTPEGRTAILLGILTITALVTGNAFAVQEEPCEDCHQKHMPAIYNEWGMSQHYAANVGCRDCHGIGEGTEEVPVPSGYDHDPPVSPVVSPRVCRRCHPAEYDEFTRSIHAKAYQCVDTNGPDPDKRCTTPSGESYWSCAQLFIRYIEGNVDGGGALAAGINGCWQCHGSRIEISEDGKPDPATWPNAGIGRINPDGSKGNCAACHQRHTFSLAEVRRPEVCGVCHNAGGGEPQSEIYHSSRHGVSFYQNADKMNLDNPKWVVGEDYSAAPTCATCHFSATPALPVTHFVDERVLNLGFKQYEEHFDFLQAARDLTCRCGPVICNNQCKVNDGDDGVPGAKWVDREQLCKINGRPDTEQAMAEVCGSCHAETLVNNYFDQYLQEVELIMGKWINPGRKLFIKAREVLKKKEGDQYAQGISAVTDAWTGICNHDARYAMDGAAMMSPGYVENNNGAISSDWYKYVAALAQVIDDNVCSENPAVKKAAKELRELFCRVLSDPTYGGAWRAGGIHREPDRKFCYNYIEKTPCKD